MNDAQEEAAKAHEKRCRWCGGRFSRREGERHSAFERRQHCNRACQVSTQNSERARRNRRANRTNGSES